MAYRYALSGSIRVISKATGRCRMVAHELEGRCELECLQYIFRTFRASSYNLYLYDGVEYHVVKSNYPHQRKGVSLAISWL